MDGVEYQGISVINYRSNSRVIGAPTRKRRVLADTHGPLALYRICCCCTVTQNALREIRIIRANCYPVGLVEDLFYNRRVTGGDDDDDDDASSLYLRNIDGVTRKYECVYTRE